ncbi:MAG: hypothetical protein COB02_08310 [Candidatus Cloacimonadota bacterium]|nr:MAG: hypothetical protein COB02_08310 [Candidatus Cloacimonadota bacterium]
MYRTLFLIFIFFISFNFSTPLQKSSSFSLLASKYFQAKNYKKSEFYYKKSLDEIPEDINSSYQLAKLYFIQDNYLQAFRYFRETLSLNKTYKNTSSLFKECIKRLKNDSSIKNSNSKEAKSFLIYLALKANQLSRAKNSIDSLIKNHPDYSFAWDHLALYYYKQEQVTEAMKALKTALSLNANSPTIFTHYEDTYYFLHHKSAPPLRKKKIEVVNNTNEDILKSLSQQIKKENKNEIETNIKQSSQSKDLEASFISKLIKQQSKYIVKVVKKSQTKKDSTTKNIYIALPTVNNEAEKETEKMLISAKTYFSEKNWELAYKIYQLLSENNPSEKNFKEKALLAKSYDDFEFDFLRARRFFQKGKKNPDNYKKSRNIFTSLDPKIYFKLYKRHSFDDYLGKIAFVTKNYIQAEKHYKSWLSKEPKDIETIYLLLLAQDFQGKRNKAFETLKRGISINRKIILSKKGISKLQIKLYVYHYWWLGLLILITWALLTFGYITIKGYRQKKTSNRKSSFELIKTLSIEERWLEMIEKIDALLLTDITAKEIQSLQYMKATGLYKAQQYSFAERQIKAVLSRYKDDKKALLLLGKIYTKQENTHEECIESYTLFYEKTSTPNLEFLKIFIRTLKTAKIFSSLTESVAQDILKIDRYNQQALIDLVEIFLKRDNIDKNSVNIYQRYLELHPNNILVNTQYLKTLLQQEEYIEIIKVAKKLINSNPDLPDIHTHLIKAFDSLGMLEEMNDYYQVLSLDYHHSPVIQQMLQLVETNYKSGIKIHRKKSDRKNQNDLQIKSFYDLGRKYMEEAKYTEAKIEFQKVIKDDILGFSATMHLVRMEIGEESWEEADFLLKQVTLLGKLKQFDLEILYDLAIHFKSGGENNKALELYQIIAKNDVSFKDTFQKIEEINSQG